MKRDLKQLASRHHDIVVVGGGIHGAALAREAALCGLSTALIEKHDFCSATSASSLKIIHGGLRYLQQFDIPRLRTSVLERRTFLRTAPHLVHPLPCIMSTQGHLMKGQEAMFCGLLLNEILSCDRNRLSDPEKFIPRGRLIPRGEVSRRVPGLATDDITGGCAWHDAYTYNSERLVTAMVRDAVAAGADAANYLRVTGLCRTGARVTGVKVRDDVEGHDFELSAGMVINAAGPWANEILAQAGLRDSQVIPSLALGMNFVLNRQLLPHSAAGLRFRRRSGDSQRLLFMMPWRGRTLAGTYYRLHEGPADALKVTAQDVEQLLADLTHAYPAAEIKPGDIACILSGLLPARHNRLVHDEPVLANHFSIVDHTRSDALDGLVSVVGVKYTTARDVAARTLRRVLAKLGKPMVRSGSDRRVLPGGHIADFRNALETAKAVPELPPAVSEHLLLNYGDEMEALIGLGRHQPAWLKPLGHDTTVIGAEAIRAVREEMALTLADVVFRRTDLGSARLPSPETLEACSRLMAEECGWNEERRNAEIKSIQDSPFYGVR